MKKNQTSNITYEKDSILRLAAFKPNHKLKLPPYHDADTYTKYIHHILTAEPF